MGLINPLISVFISSRNINIYTNEQSWKANKQNVHYKPNEYYFEDIFFLMCIANISPFVITNTENSTITIIFHGWKLAKYETVALAFLFIQQYFAQMCYCYVLLNGAEQLIFDIKYTIPIPVKT